LGLRVNDSLTLRQIVNRANFGKRFIKGSLRVAEFLPTNNLRESIVLLLLFLHVLESCSERALSLISNDVDIVCIVLSGPWIALIKHGNISNSFYGIGIDKLPILNHRA
jgi:hypothetical protein